MNNIETIIKYLKLFNEWRRGDEKISQPNPTEIGKLIDKACEMLTSLKRERDEAREIAAKYEDLYFSTLKERDEAREERDKLQVMRKEVVAANKGAKINAQVSNSLAGKLNQAERERDEAREEIDDYRERHDLLPISWEL